MPNKFVLFRVACVVSLPFFPASGDVMSPFVPLDAFGFVAAGPLAGGACRSGGTLAAEGKRGLPAPGGESSPGRVPCYIADPPMAPRMALATAISTLSRVFQTDLFIGIDVLGVKQLSVSSRPYRATNLPLSAASRASHRIPSGSLPPPAAPCARGRKG